MAGEDATIVTQHPLLTMDPAQATTRFQRSAIAEVFEGLTKVTSDGDILPNLATDWSVSDDGLEWTFQLREGITFSDGTPFDANVVVANYERLFDPDAQVAVRGSLGPVSGATIVDQYTVTIATSEPYSSLPATMSFPYWGMVSPVSIEQWGDDLGLERAAGTGPYIIESFDPPNELVLKVHETYWGDTVQTPTLTFLYQENPNTRLANLLNAAADVDFYITPDQVQEVQQNPDLQIQSVPSARMFIIHLPWKLPAIQDVRVRQAMNMAIDREQIIESVYDGLAVPAGSPVAPCIGFPTTGSYAYDPQRASELLEEAGWSLGPDHVLERDGNAFPTLRLGASSGNYPGDAELAQAVAGYLSAVGIPTELRIEPFETFFDTSRENAAKENWATLMAWASPNNDCAGYLTTIYSTQAINGSNNWGGYSNSTLDDIIPTLNGIFDPSERAEAIQDAAQLVWDDVPAIYLLLPNLIVGARADVSDLVVVDNETHVYRNMMVVTE